MQAILLGLSLMLLFTGLLLMAYCILDNIIHPWEDERDSND